MSRLLATVRWLKHRGPIIRNALNAEYSANYHTHVFEDVSDSLWHSQTSRALTSTPRPAVAYAVNILSSAALQSNTKTNSTFPSTAPNQSAFPSKSDNIILSEKNSKYVMPTPEVSDVTNHFAYSSPHQQPQQHQQLPPSSSLGSVSQSVTDRLANATRSAIRESMLHLGPVKVMAWRSGVADVCVKVGIESLWAADVLLNNLDPSVAVLRVHAIFLYVADHPASPSSRPRVSTSKSSPSSCTTPDQHAMLRSMANNRINSALDAARSISTHSNSFHLTSIALGALRDLMLDDVCTPLIMSLLRKQASALNDGAWLSSVKIDGIDSKCSRTDPLTIRYWQQHDQPALITISEVQPDMPAKVLVTAPQPSNSTNPLSQPSASDTTEVRKPICVRVVHEPPLPTAVDLGTSSTPFELKPDSLNVEYVLLHAIRTRIRARLNYISNAFLSKGVQLRIHRSCVKLCQSRRRGGAYRSSEAVPPAEDSLQIRVGSEGDPVGIDIRIFTMTGGVRVRPYGAAALSMPMRRTGGVELWTDSKHFQSNTEESQAVIAAFEIVRSRVKLNAAARSVCALDIGVSNTLPPGTASVAATASPERAASQLVPPFAPLERRAPRRFLTLSPPPLSRDILQTVHGKSGSSKCVRTGGFRGSDRTSPSKRPRLTYATTSDALVFIQESSLAGEDWFIGKSKSKDDLGSNTQKRSIGSETDTIDRYNGTAAAAAAWAVTREVVERRLRRDSLLRAFVASNVASSAQMHHTRSSEAGDLHLDSASRVLLKVKCEPLPVRRAELLLRGSDAWQVRLSLLPSIFDSTDCVPSRKDEKLGEDSESKDGAAGNLWSVGVACNGSQLTFTYPSANTETVRSFFRDLTRARTAAALARGVPPSRFYRVLRKSPVRIVVGIGPYGYENGGDNLSRAVKPLYTARVEYVYSKGNSGGFSLTFSPSRHTMEQLAPLIEEALDASGGQVGSILAGLLERACPVAAAAESAVRQRGEGKIRFVTALRVRAMFSGKQKVEGKSDGKGNTGSTIQTVNHAVDVDARGGSGLVTVIDVGRATGVMIQHGLAHRTTSGGSQRRSDFASLPKWDEIVEALTRKGHAEAQRAGSTVVLRMEMLEQFLTNLVISSKSGVDSGSAPGNVGAVSN